MKLRKVDPKKIMVPEVRVTGEFDPETKEMLRQSMATDGLIAPIICIETPEGLTLVDGFNRLMEAINAKWPTIDVAVVEGTMVDVLTRNLYIDSLRGKHKPSEMVKVIEALWKEYQLDSEKIAAKTGLKRDYIETLQLISELTPMVREYLDQEKIKLGHAKALTRLKDPVKQEVALHQITTFGMSVKDTDQMVTDALGMAIPPPAPPAPPPAGAPTKVRCSYCGDEVELQHIANPNTCSGCSMILAQSIAAARAELAAGLAAKQNADDGNGRKPDG
jgi:ParB family chromosome partitioning protein